MSRNKSSALRRRDPVKLGFLPVCGCAPLVYAHESGLFQKYDLDVELVRETSWAGVRDKVINGELDAAQTPATLPFLANLGLESDPCACVSALVLNLQANAITISAQLWEQGVKDGATFRERIYKDWGHRTYTLGIAFPYSSSQILMTQWLKSAGIKEEQIRIVIIHPDQMYPTLKLGYIDGFCACEPWNSVAVQAGAGVCIATSAELAPLHPENVLMVRQSFATGRADEHERLLAALIESCAFCDHMQNRPMLADMLSEPHYINAPAEALNAGLAELPDGGNDQSRDLADITIYHRHNANDPSDDKAAWLMTQLYACLDNSLFRRLNGNRTPVLKNVFRMDIYERAKTMLQEHAAAFENEKEMIGSSAETEYAGCALC